MSARTDAVFAALAEPTRRAVVDVLARGTASAGDIADRVGVTPAVLTRHLRVLRDAGLVTATLDQSDHRRHVYELLAEPLEDVRAWVEGATQFWQGQLDAFARHAGRRARRAPSRGSGARAGR